MSSGERANVFALIQRDDDASLKEDPFSETAVELSQHAASTF